MLKDGTYAHNTEISVSARKFYLRATVAPKDLF